MSDEPSGAFICYSNINFLDRILNVSPTPQATCTHHFSFFFNAFNAGLFLVFMPSNSKSPSHFSDIYCSAIKAQGLNLLRDGPPEPLK